jgi:teichoic acid D-alanine hydrolase
MQKGPRYEIRHKGQKKRLIPVPAFICTILIVAIAYLTYHQLSGQPLKKTEDLNLNNAEPGQVLNQANNPDDGIENNKKIERYLNKIQFNGTAVIVKNGKVILNKGYGLANRVRQINNSPNTVYYIGSITKSVVATAFMQLQENGKVSGNEPLSNFLPSFPHAREIKLNNLLTHTSGIPVRNEFGGKLSKEALMKNIGITAQNLTSQPGTKWGYSDANYAILGYVVEKVSGIPLHVYIKEHIFKVAGMVHSGFGTDLKKEKYPSTGYKVKLGITYTPQLPDFSQVYGCGDIYMTSYDLYKFDKALESGKLVSKESYKQILTPHKAHYGFGWYINRKGWYVKPGNYSSHGVLPGWNGFNSYSKDGRVYVVLLSNLQNNIKSYASVSKELYMQLADTKS